MDAPKLSRAYTFETRATQDDDGLTLEGYAAVFNSPTDINDREGSYRERILPGSFSRSISKRTPVLQFDHGQHPLLGSIPLGSIETLREDNHGLFVRALLHDNWLVEPVRDAIRSGAVDGMSFRFAVRKDKWSQDRSERTISEVELFELGPVVFPAYADTSVGVRSQQLVDLLADPEIRADLARVLFSGDMPVRGSHDEPQNDIPTPDADSDHASEPDISVVRKRALTLAGVVH